MDWLSFWYGWGAGWLLLALCLVVASWFNPKWPWDDHDMRSDL